MRSLTSVAAVVMTLTGCAMTSEQYLPDGSKGYGIRCPGAANSINSCFEKAGELCGTRGYEVLNRDGSVIMTSASSANVKVNSGGGYGSANTMPVGWVERNILVRCKTSAPVPSASPQANQ